MCRVEPPEYATRLDIVAGMARRMGLGVPENVCQYMAANLTNHARELSGALCRLEAASRAWGRPIDRSLAEEVLADMIRPPAAWSVWPTSRRPCAKPLASFRRASNRGARPSASASRACWPCGWRKYTRAALTEIGSYFGRRSHSTVVSAQKRVEGWLAEGSEVELADSTWKIDEAIRKVEQKLLAG